MSTAMAGRSRERPTAHDPSKVIRGSSFLVSHVSSRYNGTETVLSSSPFASVTSATARPSFNDGVMLTA